MQTRKVIFVAAALVLLVIGCAAFQSQMNINALFAVEGSPNTGQPASTATWFNPAVTTPVVAKPAEGNLYGYYVRNESTADCYVQLWDAEPTASPAGILRLSFGLGPGQAANLFDGLTAIAHFQRNITVATATTANGTTPCGAGVSVNLFLY